MQLWTTPHLNDLFLGDCLSTRLLPPDEIHAAFLKSSRQGDAALLPFISGYLEFLKGLKARGITGPIMFISAEPTMVKEDLYPYNAIVFDMKSNGIAWVRDVVHVLLNLSAVQNQPDEDAPGAQAAPLDAGWSDRVITDAGKIRELLAYSIKTDSPAITLFDVQELGEPVTARGICNLKGIEADQLVFSRFRQALLLKGVRGAKRIQVVFTTRDGNMQTGLTVRSAGDKDIFTSFPEQLFPTKDIRLQPKASRPVNLSMLIPNEPTTNYKVMDISTKGIGFLCTRDLPIGNTYSFTLNLPDPHVMIVCAGTLRFKNETGSTFRYGAEIHPHPWDEEHIASYVIKREMEILGLIRG